MPSWGTFRMHIFIEIKNKIDSRSLWNLIEKYKVNLTDLEEVSLVYGDVDTITAMEVITCCALFGDLKIELSKGSQK